MGESSCLEFLRQHGADQVGHSGRKLADHLSGTYHLLRKWQCHAATCYAGLFHSVYGTNAYRHSIIRLGLRAQVVQLIGDEAEYLVYLFHVAERPGAWLAALHDGHVMNRFTGQSISVDETTIARLIEVECANLIDQRRAKRFFSALAWDLDTLSSPLWSRVSFIVRQRHHPFAENRSTNVTLP